MENLEIQAGYEQTEENHINERKQRLLAFAEEILKKRKLAVEHRATSGVERRWTEDEEAFNEGLEADHLHNVTDYATGSAPVRQKETTRSKVTANIIRGRCETAEGRFVDVVFPVEGKNWSMETTPIPEMADAMDDDRTAIQNGMPVIDDATGQPARMKDVAVDMKERAEKAMALMEEQIDDQLAECDYNSEARKVIRSAIKLGTGVLKGPLVIKDVKKSWDRQDDGTGNIAYVIKMIEDHAPASKAVDVWNVYPSPDCSDNIQRASYIWERGETSRRELYSLIGVEGYDEEMIREVMDEDPQRLVVGESKPGRYRAKVTALENGSLYETWEYNGDVDKEDLLAMGCECPDTAPSFRACVLFVNDKPIKADLSLIDTGDLPYDFFVWSPVDGSPFGIGIPRQMYWWQRIIRGALRQMMDNAADSARTHIVVSDQMQPVNGDWNGRFWEFIPGSTIDDIRKAFQQFQTTNNQAQFQAVIELALRFVDLETVVPAIFQGEAQEIPETLGATNIMVNSANIAFRMRLKHWDDYVTRPHIRRYYDWNMQYNKRNEIKGDYKVVPIGATSLYEQDQHGQRLINLLQMGQHPAFAKVDWEKVGEQILRAWHIDAMKSEEQLEQDQQNQPQAPPNPQAEVAQIRVEGEMAKAELNQKSDMEELNFKAQQADLDRQHEAQMKIMERDMLMLKLAAQQNISLESIKGALAGKTMELQTQKELAYNVKQAKQVSETNMEPVGQAPAGEAFQK